MTHLPDIGKLNTRTRQSRGSTQSSCLLFRGSLLFEHNLTLGYSYTTYMGDFTRTISDQINTQHTVDGTTDHEWLEKKGMQIPSNLILPNQGAMDIGCRAALAVSQLSPGYEQRKTLPSKQVAMHFRPGKHGRNSKHQ